MEKDKQIEALQQRGDQNAPFYGDCVIHSGAYYLKAVILDDGRPKAIFRSDLSNDLEISIDDNGALALGRSTIKTIGSAAMLAGQGAQNQ